jgi:hypothetical protein
MTVKPGGRCQLQRKNKHNKPTPCTALNRKPNTQKYKYLTPQPIACEEEKTEAKYSTLIRKASTQMR